MNMATVTGNGRVTIPSKLRQELGINAGDRLMFFPEPSGMRIHVVKHRSISELFGILPATRPYPGMDAIRKEIAWDIAREVLGLDEEN